MYGERHLIGRDSLLQRGVGFVGIHGDFVQGLSLDNVGIGRNVPTVPGPSEKIRTTHLRSLASLHGGTLGAEFFPQMCCVQDLG